jgi:hypothetical protein
MLIVCLVLVVYDFGTFASYRAVVQHIYIIVDSFWVHLHLIKQEKSFIELTMQYDMNRTVVIYIKPVLHFSARTSKK